MQSAVAFTQTCLAVSQDGVNWERDNRDNWSASPAFGGPATPVLSADPQVLKNCGYQFQNGNHIIDMTAVRKNATAGKTPLTCAGDANVCGVGHPSAITVPAGSSSQIQLYYYDSSSERRIEFDRGAFRTVTNCTVRHFANRIVLRPSGATNFSISNTLVSNNGGFGVSVSPSGTAKGVIDQVAVTGSQNGVFVQGTGSAANVMIVNSVMTNIFTGVVSTLVPASETVRGSIASDNRGSFSASKPGVLRLSHSVAAGNALGVEADTGGTLFSYSDNGIDGNTNNKTSVLTAIPTH